MRRRAFLSAAPAVLLVGAAPSPPPAVVEVRPGAIEAGDHLVKATLPLGTYEGTGPESRLICAPGVDSLFSGSGALVLRNLSIVGNGSGRSYASGFATNVQDGSIELDSVNLENFRGNYWVLGQRSRLFARRVTAVSRSGNAIDGKAITQLAHVLCVIDGELDVADCELHCAYIKGGVAVFGASTATVTRTLIADSGTSAEIADNAAAYAILAYAHPSGRPRLTVVDSVIDGARSCGIYAASCDSVDVRGTRFARIDDRRDDTLPKAAISLNGSPNFSGSGNSFTSCYKKIVLADKGVRSEPAID
jgi:hypothetical protein